MYANGTWVLKETIKIMVFERWIFRMIFVLIRETDKKLKNATYRNKGSNY